MNINGVSPLRSLLPIDSDGRIWNIRDNLSWVHGRHSIKGGLEINRPRTFGQDLGNIFGTYSFTGQFTGVPFGDFLLGLPGTASRSLPLGAIGQRSLQTGVYITDDIRVTPI